MCHTLSLSASPLSSCLCLSYLLLFFSLSHALFPFSLSLHWWHQIQILLKTILYIYIFFPEVLSLSLSLPLSLYHALLVVSHAFIFQESLSVTAAVSDIEEPAPTLMIKESLEGQVKEVFLISENEVLCKIPPQKSPLYLLAGFYVFNMKYPKGLVSLYTFFEILCFF